MVYGISQSQTSPSAHLLKLNDPSPQSEEEAALVDVVDPSVDQLWLCLAVEVGVHSFHAATMLQMEVRGARGALRSVEEVDGC